MEIIEISSYTEEDKVHIALGYLIPKQIKEHGLKEKHIEFSEGAVRKIIREYTREAGVRNLERQIASICRKVARMVVEDPKTFVSVTGSNVSKFLGREKYRFGVAEKEDQVGVATGLAWTETGGDILSVEVALLKGKGKLILTGKLGDVMKESAQAALTYVKSRAEELGIKPEDHTEYDLHLHVPEGAIPKDGPSAGIAIATALASALSGNPARSDVAMTGEITLRGQVLPSTQGKACRSSRRHTNGDPAGGKQKDLEDIPGNVRRKLNFVTVSHMDVLAQTLIRPAQEHVQPS